MCLLPSLLPLSLSLSLSLSLCLCLCLCRSLSVSLCLSLSLSLSLSLFPGDCCPWLSLNLSCSSSSREAEAVTVSSYPARSSSAFSSNSNFSEKMEKLGRQVCVCLASSKHDYMYVSTMSTVKYRGKALFVHLLQTCALWMCTMLLTVLRTVFFGSTEQSKFFIIFLSFCFSRQIWEPAGGGVHCSRGQVHQVRRHLHISCEGTQTRLTTVQKKTQINGKRIHRKNWVLFHLCRFLYVVFVLMMLISFLFLSMCSMWKLRISRRQWRRVTLDYTTMLGQLLVLSSKHNNECVE